jgi:predicted RNA-binding Zn-ribbon protein involved in translation (DUF1610 family)
VQIKVSDFRGVVRAEIECAPIALVAGLNRAGKSSLAQAVGAVLSARMRPVERAAGAALVRVGARNMRAEISVKAETGELRGQWPSGRIDSDGAEPPWASEYAVGLASIVHLQPRDRARVLAGVLKADPTLDDLKLALPSDGLAAAIWEDIERDGWDPTHESYRERGAQLKGQWRQVTGAVYGARVGASWRPDFEAAESDAELEAIVTRAKAAFESAVAAQAVTADERSRLTDEVAARGEYLEAIGHIERQIERAAEDRRVAMEKRQALPPVEQERGFPCPHCGEPIIAVRVSAAETRFEKPRNAALTDSEVKKRRIAIADADGDLAHASDQVGSLRRQLASAQAALQRSDDAQKRLDDIRAAGRVTDARPLDVDSARAEMNQVQQRLANARRKREADKLHDQIAAIEAVVALLAGDGLRGKKLDRKLDAFNEELRSMAGAAGWPVASVDREMGLSLEGRPFGLLSASEQWRVRALLQTAIAAADGSQMLIMDGADILDAPSRAGLFGLIDHAGLPALVCMTLARPEQCPDLRPTGRGASYWIEAGVTRPISDSAGLAA